MARIIFTTSQEQFDAVQRVMGETGIAQAELMRRAVEDYLKRQYNIEANPSVDRGGYRERKGAEETK